MNRDRRWPVPNLTAISLSTRLLPIALALLAQNAPAGDFQGASRPSDLSSLIYQPVAGRSAEGPYSGLPVCLGDALPFDCQQRRRPNR